MLPLMLLMLQCNWEDDASTHLCEQTFRISSHLVLCHGTNYKWANHTRQSAHTIGDTHEDASISGCNVQVVDIETLWGSMNTIRIIYCIVDLWNLLIFVAERFLRNTLYSMLERRLKEWIDLSYVFTWNSKARETHSQDQECNGNTFCMGETHYQQQSCLHPKPWWRWVKYHRTKSEFMCSWEKVNWGPFSLMPPSYKMLFLTATSNVMYTVCFYISLRYWSSKIAHRNKASAL